MLYTRYPHTACGRRDGPATVFSSPVPGQSERVRVALTLPTVSGPDTLVVLTRRARISVSAASGLRVRTCFEAKVFVDRAVTEGMSADREPARGDEYRHPDGTVEVVFATEAGRVLTVREYSQVDQFSEAVDAATYQGVNEDVAALLPAESFAGQDEEF